jgi:hypothetical protein
MRAFFVGLLFLLVVAILAGVGVVLLPLLAATIWSFRLIVMFLFVIFAIWFLGKFVIFVWEKMKK